MRSSVGHGEEETLVMILLEVLIFELLTIDGLPTGTLCAVMGQYITRSAKTREKQKEGVNSRHLSGYLRFHG